MRRIGTVFFLDTRTRLGIAGARRTGYPRRVAVRPGLHGQRRSNVVDEARDTSGAEISGSPISVLRPLPSQTPSHGWMALRAGLSSAFQGTGTLLVTSDGGANWKLATATGWDKYDIVGPMLMVTPQFGWLVGAGASAPLLVTRDGGRTWHGDRARIAGENRPNAGIRQTLGDLLAIRSSRQFHPPQQSSRRSHLNTNHTLRTTYPISAIRNTAISASPIREWLYCSPPTTAAVSWKPQEVVQGRPPGRVRGGGL